MESDDDNKPRLKMSLELNQEEPQKKKKRGGLQRILEVLKEEVRRGREEGESRDPSDW